MKSKTSKLSINNYLLCLFLVSIVIVSSISITHAGKATDWIKSKINENVSTMSDEMLSGVGENVSAGAEAIGDDFISSVTASLGPDLRAFDNFVSGRDIADTSATTFLNVKGKFVAVAQVFGFGMAIIIFIFSLMKYFIAKPGEIRDTPLRLVLRFFMALFLIYYSSEVMDEVLKVANNVWTDYIMTTIVAGKPQTLSFSDLAPVDVSGESPVIGLFKNLGKGAAFAAITILFPGLAAFIVIIAILIYWPLIKGFIKLYVEIVERYIVVVLLYLFFGAAASTIVSNETSNVFKSYMRMVASQIFILFVNALFMHFLVNALVNGWCTTSIPNYIFALGYITVCQKIDSYMAMLGLNVAQTGGQTLDALLGATGGMVRGLENMGKTASKGASLASAAAEKGGNFTTAATLKGMSGAKGAAEVIGNGGIEPTARLMAAKAGKSFEATPEESANAIKDVLSDPTNAKKQEILNGYDNESLTNGLNKILADSGSNARASEIDRTALRRGKLGFKGQIGEGPNAQDISGTLSSMELAKGDNIKTGAGYLSFDDKLKSSPNEIHKGNIETLSAISGKGKVLNSAPESFKQKIAGMSYNGKTGDYNLVDSENNRIGTICNIDGKESLIMSAKPDEAEKTVSVTGSDREKTTMSGANDITSAKQMTDAYALYGKSASVVRPDGKIQTSKAKADMNMQKIKDTMGFKTLDVQKVDPQTGIAHATATIADPYGGDDKRVDVLMKDMGMHDKSKNGTVVDMGDGHALDIQTRPVSGSKIETASSKKENHQENEKQQGKPAVNPTEASNPHGKGAGGADTDSQKDKPLNPTDNQKVVVGNENPNGNSQVETTQSNSPAPSRIVGADEGNNSIPEKPNPIRYYKCNEVSDENRKDRNFNERVRDDMKDLLAERAKTGNTNFSKRYTDRDSAEVRAQAAYSLGYKTKIAEHDGVYDVHVGGKTDFYNNLDDSLKEGHYDTDRANYVLRWKRKNDDATSTSDVLK